MGRKTVKVPEDFYHKDFKEGEIVITSYGENVRIENLDYKNEYGSFILCESVEEEAGEVTVAGVDISAENPYELIGTIQIPGDILQTIGCYIKDRDRGGVKGFAFQEAWELIYQEGAVNAQARYKDSVRQINTIESVPDLDSHYWSIFPYRDTGELFAPLSQDASIELTEALRYASQKLAEKRTADILIETHLSPADIRETVRQIDEAGRIAVLTGAGVSTMSGIPDYRSVAIGMWQKDPQLLEYLNEATFQRDPALFWEKFYQLIWNTLIGVMPFPNHQSLLAAIEAIQPNEAHKLFNWLEEEKGKEVSIVTQNVDRLHQKAGNQKVIEFHGNVLECVCRNCGKRYGLADVLTGGEAPRCERCAKPLRPNAVFFGDPVKELDEATAVLEKAELVLVAGTSLQVYPFSSLVHHVVPEVKIIYLNGEAPENPGLFDIVLTGNLSLISRELMAQFKRKVR